MDDEETDWAEDKMDFEGGAAGSSVSFGAGRTAVTGAPA